MFIENEVQLYDDFLKQLAEEDWQESKNRPVPDLPNITHDIHQNRISYKGDVTIKPEGVELPLVESGKYEEFAEEIYHCYTHPLYTIKNYVKIIHPDRGIIPLILYDYQVEYIQDCFKEKRLIIKWPRQSGKTTSSAALILFFVLFNKNKEIAILANKQSTTKEILDRIKVMYRHLPMWLKPGIREWNKHSIEFENGCKITAASTSAASISGKTISLLYIDEFALIPKNIIEDFIDSTFPVIAASQTSRILISSTPKGKNHFYRFFMDAKNREKTKSPFIAKDIPWDAHPDRNEEWRIAKIKELGSEERFNQEFGGDFLDTSDMLIRGSAIEYLERNYRTAPLGLNLTLDGEYIKGLKIYEKPKRKIAGVSLSKDHSYVLVADIGEGKGLDASACSVIDVTHSPFKVVATFKNSEVGIIEFPYIIYQLGTYYNDAYVIVENNFDGSSVVKDLWYELEYPNIVNLNFLSESKMKQTQYTELGVKTTKRSKKQGCLFLKYLIENHKLVIPDTDTIDELYHFVRNPLKGTYSAESGYNDDLVMTLVIFSYMAKTQDYFKYILYEQPSDPEKIQEFDPDEINPFVIDAYKDEFYAKEKEDLKNKSLFIQSLGGDKGKSLKEQEIEKAQKDISWLF